MSETKAKRQPEFDWNAYRLVDTPIEVTTEDKFDGFVLPNNGRTGHRCLSPDCDRELTWLNHTRMNLSEYGVYCVRCGLAWKMAHKYLQGAVNRQARFEALDELVELEQEMGLDRALEPTPTNAVPEPLEEDDFLGAA